MCFDSERQIKVTKLILSKAKIYSFVQFGLPVPLSLLARPSFLQVSWFLQVGLDVDFLEGGTI